MKKCPVCKQEKQSIDFCNCKSYPDGLDRICKDCKNARRQNRKGRLTAKQVKERFMYHAVIEEAEIENFAFLTYGEILEIVQKVCK